MRGSYPPMARLRKASMYLAAVMDWHSRKVLGWALSNMLDTFFCLEALEMALKIAGCAPEIFNTDQGCQFTSEEWINRLKYLDISISMDSKGRWMDNVVIERFWRSLKYDDIYLKYYDSIPELTRGIERYIKGYNSYRPHQALGKRTRPLAEAKSRLGGDDVYYGRKAA